MSKRRDLETRIHGLNDIEEIMNAMKNLALMETHRLARFLDTQRRVVASVESVAADFPRFHTNLLPGEEEFRDAYLIVGSERGFCGDFNESLLQAFDEKSAGKQAEPWLSAESSTRSLPTIRAWRPWFPARASWKRWMRCFRKSWKS